MRIIGGEHRGRRLEMPKGKAIRPTQDRVREAVFNVIRAGVPGSKVLDLFAGSGAFGIEALSHGAQSSIFVDDNIKCIKVINSNLLSLGYKSPCAEVLKKDAISAITGFKRKSAIFDIIFLDPPYYKGLAKNSLIKIGAYDILSQRGFAVAEHFTKDDMPDRAGRLSLFKRKRYGTAAVSFYRGGYG